jgi:nicotinamide-nucleotide amidase
MRRPPRVEILGTGDELVRGRGRDTNTPWIAAAATAAGCVVTGTRVVGDDPPALVAAMRAAAAGGADAVVVTGGLGPTADDCTRPAAAALLRVPLLPHAPSLRRLKGLWRRRGRPMPPSNESQALLPRGASVIPNPVGSAPGLRFDHRGTTFHCLPGVPREMEAMFLQSVLPRLRRLARGMASASRSLGVFGPSESEFGERIGDLMRRDVGVRVGTSVGDGIIQVHVHGTGKYAVEVPAVHAEILRRAGADAFSAEGLTLARTLVPRLLARGLTVSVAESCTAGLVAARLAEVPGVSAVFPGGVIAYANAQKTRLLGVPASLLAKHGAVSAPVAKAMAMGARKRFGTDFAVSITGVAGPDGGSAEKPVGLVWFAVAGPRGVEVVERRFTGNREFVRSIAANAALDLLRRAVLQ